MTPSELRASSLATIERMRWRLAWARAVAGDATLPKRAYRVAAFMAEAYDELHCCFATGREKIAAGVSLAVSSVQQALDDLERHGWIARIGDPSRGRHATRYALVFRIEPTGDDRSVADGATDRSEVVGCEAATDRFQRLNRPVSAAQPTGFSGSTDRSWTGRYQDDQDDQEEDQDRAGAIADESSSSGPSIAGPKPDLASSHKARLRVALAKHGMRPNAVGVEEWFRYLKREPRCASIEEAEAFLAWVAEIAERQGQTLEHTRHLGSSVAEDWRKHRQLVWRRKQGAADNGQKSETIA